MSQGTATTPRHTAEERRRDVLAAAIDAFAATGMDGTSTETIAHAVGISQPYLFRLFGTKKELFIAAIESCFGETQEAFERAGAGAHSPGEAFHLMGQAYHELIADRSRLRLQMQAYAACEDPQIRAVVQRRFGELVRSIALTTGADAEQLAHFLARGMLLNVMASIGVLGSTTGWAAMVREGCMAELD